jgi:hypothetical protein
LLSGNRPDERYPIPAEWRDYIIAKTFGYTKQQIDDSPAVWLDWMLSIDGAFKSVEAKNGSPSNLG